MASPPKGKLHAYRIVSSQYPPFDGGGVYRWGSRWISPGRWVIHAAETYALAVLENLVHWQSRALPPNLLCLAVRIPKNLKQERLDSAPVGDDNYINTRALGDAWYDAGKSAVLWVPSVVSPYEDNLLINQKHPDFKRVATDEPVPAQLDPRLWGAG